MKKCRYVTCHNDHHFYVCDRCGRLEYGRIPVYEEVERYWKRCPQCKMLVKVPKSHRATKHGIIAMQGRIGDGIYLYNAHTKKFIGHSIHHKRMSSKELADHIEAFVEFRRKFANG